MVPEPPPVAPGTLEAMADRSSTATKDTSAGASNKSTDDDIDPLDQMMDLLFFAPLGFAVESVNLFPEMAKRGRTEVNNARVIGGFAITKLKRTVAGDPTPSTGGTTGGSGGSGGGDVLSLQKVGADLLGALLPKPKPMWGGPPVVASTATETATKAQAKPKTETKASDKPTAKPSGESKKKAAKKKSAAKAKTATKKKAAATKSSAKKKAAAKKSPAKKSTGAAKSSAKKSSAKKKTVTKKSASNKSSAKKKATAKKTSAKKAATKKGSAKKAAAPAAAPVVETLAIPGYDELSASQVVPMLRSLNKGELRQIQRYESANRGRKTILGQVAQLLAA